MVWGTIWSAYGLCLSTPELDVTPLKSDISEYFQLAPGDQSVSRIRLAVRHECNLFGLTVLLSQFQCLTGIDKSGSLTAPARPLERPLCGEYIGSIKSPSSYLFPTSELRPLCPIIHSQVCCYFPFYLYLSRHTTQTVARPSTLKF